MELSGPMPSPHGEIEGTPNCRGLKPRVMNALDLCPTSKFNNPYTFIKRVPMQRPNLDAIMRHSRHLDKGLGALSRSAIRTNLVSKAHQGETIEMRILLMKISDTAQMRARTAIPRRAWQDCSQAAAAVAACAIALPQD